MVYYILEDKVHRQDKAGQGLNNLEAMADCCSTDSLSMAPSGLLSDTTQ